MAGVSNSSREGRDIAWIFFKKNFNAIKAMVGNANTSLMSIIITSCAIHFCSNEKADEIEAFFKANPVPQSSRKIQQILENMRSNAKLFASLQNSDLKSAEFWSSI
jgi:puromycin-sensitive aminopeptidase